MNRRIRPSDKVEIVDRNSQYFGETGILTELRSQPQQMIGFNSKTISSTTIFYAVVKLDKTETIEVFTLEQVRKIS